MSAGSKIRDTEQEYQYSVPFVSPSGHEFSFYDTPDNERLVIKHTSGSHIEFKADGSVFISAVKDLHTHSSVLSAESEQAQSADNTTQRIDTDHTLDVAGRLKIKCAELDIEVGSTGKIYAATDFIVNSNNYINKATESIQLSSTKSIYVDTKEMRERVVARQTEAGTMEDGEKGGINVMKVYGNTIIQNDDENGGITIASKGYLNLVSGHERVDLVGKFTDTPSEEAEGTFTTKVYANPGTLDVSSVPGDVYFESEAGAYYSYATTVAGSSGSGSDGFYEEVTLGNRVRNVSAGLEEITISGTQTTTAAMIYLN